MVSSRTKRSCEVEGVSDWPVFNLALMLWTDIWVVTIWTFTLQKAGDHFASKSSKLSRSIQKKKAKRIEISHIFNHCYCIESRLSRPYPGAPPRVMIEVVVTAFSPLRLFAASSTGALAFLVFLVDRPVPPRVIVCNTSHVNDLDESFLSDSSTLDHAATGRGLACHTLYRCSFLAIRSAASYTKAEGAILQCHLERGV
jgi:hypothetical protein